MAQAVEHGINALARMRIDLLALRSSMKLSLAIGERQAAALLTPAFATLSQRSWNIFCLFFPVHKRHLFGFCADFYFQVKALI